MKVYTSYFYQIRNFKKNMVPISTCCSDPIWFHQRKGNNYVFKDKNGIYNGIRCQQLAPDNTCKDLCMGDCVSNTPDTCLFLQNYQKQLDKIDFQQFISNLELLLDRIRHIENLEEIIPVFIVYETPDNKCSERQSLINWFNKNGIECKELDYPIW